MPSRDLEARMWAEACDMLDRADRMHRQFFRVTRSPEHRPAWEPPIDIYETEREVLIVVALPGVEPGRVEVVIESDALIIRGERRMPVASDAPVIRRLEIPHGRFERRIDLPAVHLDVARKEMSHGCLWLNLLKS